ncbi:MAG TPA: hypothetical protein VKB35_10655 [Ktedonobacteraceae bacterium]|nr:hypothetical protein [Ktedonobacteraceae bacterium]
MAVVTFAIAPSSLQRVLLLLPSLPHLEQPFNQQGRTKGSTTHRVSRAGASPSPTIRRLPCVLHVRRLLLHHTRLTLYDGTR